MRDLITSCLILSASCILFISPVKGQPLQQDSSVRLARERAASLYHSYLGGQSALYSGIAHLTYDPTLHGTPYFQADETARGNVLYDGIQYSNVPMLYDLVRDQLVVADPTGYLICLYSPRVHDFTLRDHHFILASREGTPEFYDLLCTGTFTILAKRTKRIDETIVAMEIDRSVSGKDFFYAVRDGNYHSVSNQRSLLLLMADKKKAIRQFIHSNHIRFRKDPEQAIIKITGYYNQLSQ